MVCRKGILLDLQKRIFDNLLKKESYAEQLYLWYKKIFFSALNMNLLYLSIVA